jgi:hypothetical protein
LPPPPPGEGLFGPLQETRDMADIESSEARIFRKFMSPHGERVPAQRLRRHDPSTTLRWRL